MAYDYSPITWTDEQWALVTDTIQREASRARVAATFLPLYGPLPPDTDYVARDRLVEPGPGAAGTLSIEDTTTVQVPTLQVKVGVRGAQMADPELTSVLQLFRRAANVLARLEDAIVFGGQPEPYKGPALADSLPGIWEILGGQATDGLLDGAPESLGVEANGDKLVTGVSEAIGLLEGNGQFGPFAVVLGQDLFTAVQKPSDSLVLPQDRIIPFLEGGPLLRSTLIDGHEGVVVALGGSPVELVVATDMSLNFLQVTTDPMFVFRVFEKVVLRIKEPNAILRLRRPNA
jgi:uncharacterized linocin/CFP29 family protein